MLREKIKGLETRVVMIRHGNDNEVIASRLQRWTQRMLQVQHAQQVPAAIVCRPDRGPADSAGIRVGHEPALASEAFTTVRRHSHVQHRPLTAPHCGINSGLCLAGRQRGCAVSGADSAWCRRRAQALAPVSALILAFR
jgi:uncharacterized protein YigA (DUF484 family)